jgi:hypothetical protein
MEMFVECSLLVTGVCHITNSSLLEPYDQLALRQDSLLLTVNHLNRETDPFSDTLIFLAIKNSGFWTKSMHLVILILSNNGHNATCRPAVK